MEEIARTAKQINFHSITQYLPALYISALLSHSIRLFRGTFTLTIGRMTQTLTHFGIVVNIKMA